MNIALIGYGKMGKVIEEIALERGHTIVAKISSELLLSDADLSHVDVAIEFSKPDLAVEHIHACLKLQIPIIVGTTGWSDRLEEVERAVNQTKGSLLYASNFSIGVNIFFEINKRLAQLMSGQPGYSACMEEIHHLQKLDAPSGTAITLANAILENNPDYGSWVLGEEKVPHTNIGQLGVTSYRKPDVPGTHTIHYSSSVDTLTISHEAHNRNGFAIGAVIAAEWLFGKKGIYTMNDVLNLNIP
ncbi:MAG: 4-hydroxy-tetrahydrodipicolinate reductase [Bacteroidota bacterium]